MQWIMENFWTFVAILISILAAMLVFFIVGIACLVLYLRRRDAQKEQG